VAVGDVIGERVEVASGLAAGEAVVVAGQERLRDGARVTVVPASETPNGEARP
jgi:multidrug efflux pump subunit AcrA (membrane-fusion protein)